MRRRRSRLARRIAATALFAWGAAAAAPQEASLCDNLDEIPVHYQLDYNAAIQGIFNRHCTVCHVGPSPSAGMDLSSGHSWANLVGHASNNGLYTRVVPNQPQNSLLFHKVNCDVPDTGQRMPLGDTPLSGEEQAQIADWIAGGAPAGSLDVLFRGGFETRY